MSRTFRTTPPGNMHQAPGNDPGSCESACQGIKALLEMSTAEWHRHCREATEGCQTGKIHRCQEFLHWHNPPRQGRGNPVRLHRRAGRSECRTRPRCPATGLWLPSQPTTSWQPPAAPTPAAGASTASGCSNAMKVRCTTSPLATTGLCGQQNGDFCTGKVVLGGTTQRPVTTKCRLPRQVFEFPRESRDPRHPAGRLPGS